MRTLIALVSMVVSGSSLADTVRHLQVPERFWGTWARSPDLCRDKKSIIVVSDKGYVTPEASCEIQWLTETAGGSGPIYSAHMRCTSLTAPDEKTELNRIILPKEGGQLSAGPDFHSGARPTSRARTTTANGASPQRVELGRCSPAPAREACCQNFVDATAIEIDDFEAPALGVETLSDLRQMAEPIEHETRRSVIIALLGNFDVQPVGHLIHRHTAGDQPRTIPTLHSIGFAFMRLRTAHDRFQNVGIGDHPLKMAVLVVNQSHVNRGPLDHLQYVERVGGVGDVGRGPHMRARIRRFTAQICFEQILGLQHAQHVVWRTVVNGQP